MSIIIVVLLSSSVAFGASIIKNSYFNPDLKLVINNNEVQDIQIVTVEIEGEKYGHNYYSIADIVKALNKYGGINAELNYNPETKTTTINIEQEGVIMSIMSVENESDEIMEETNEVVAQNEQDNKRIRKPYNSVDIALIEKNVYENMNTFKYNNNYYVSENDLINFTSTEFKSYKRDNKLHITNSTTFNDLVLEENADYIIVDSIIYYNINIRV